MRKSLLVLSVLFLSGGLSLSACSTTRLVFQDPPKDAPEAKIGFVQHHGIYSWHAETDTLLYVQAADRSWYRVDLFSPCIGIDFANRVAFLPSDSAGDFDRFSYVVSGRQRCKVQSVKQVPPPMKVDKNGPSATPSPPAKPGVS